jgi:hypothetical protein
LYCEQKEIKERELRFKKMEEGIKELQKGGSILSKKELEMLGMGD